MKKSEFWIPVVVSVVATPVCLLLAVGSAGAGHGDYVLARILFPFSMLSALLFGEITAPAVALAVVQLPLYGLVLGFSAERGRAVVALLGLLAAHALAAAACFVDLGGSFL